MNMQEQHEMILEKTHSSGTEEWYCPECGRRMLLNWNPNYQKIVLVPGNEFAFHSGGKGGVKMQASRLDSTEKHGSDEDHRLAVWSKWMRDIHFDDWWDDDE